MTTVAAETGPDVFVLYDEPLWRVLYRYRHIEERRHRQELVDRLNRVDAGMMASLGVNTPDALNDELQKARTALAEFDTPPLPADVLLARGLALAAKVEQGRVLSDEALTSE